MPSRASLLLALVCFAPLVGCASGNSALGGRETRGASLRSGDALVARSFITSSKGWAVGATKEDGALVASTEDGGRSWTVLLRDPNALPLVDVDFVDARRGWAVSSSGTLAGGILATRDGGLSWTAQGTDYGPLESVDFTDEDHGVVRGWDGDSPQRRITLSTEDGGATWTSFPR